MPAALATIAAASLIGLSGCVALGIHAAREVFGDKEKPPALHIQEAQEAAISAAHGGLPDQPIHWTAPKSGIKGTLEIDPAPDGANGCRQYRQTLVIAAQVLHGALSACPQTDGSWKLTPAAQPID